MNGKISKHETIHRSNEPVKTSLSIRLQDLQTAAHTLLAMLAIAGGMDAATGANWRE
jgi:hypothetical protein